MSEPNPGAIRAGGVDWVAHWADLVRKRRIMIEGLANQGPQARFWETRADRYARRVASADPAANPLTQGVLGLARAGDTALDVGAGTGRYAIPLAGVVRSVTAVEPSEAMRGQLEQGLATHGVANVRIVASSWEQAEVDEHDLVLCSNVLYPIEDVAPFIMKLDEKARRACAIILRVDQMGAMIEPLWKEIWGEVKPPEPGLLDLYNLLFALGIRANARLAPRAAAQQYDDLDDALAQTRNQLFLPADQHQHDERIRSFLAATLVAVGEGFEAPVTPQYALVWWEKS